MHRRFLLLSFIFLSFIAQAQKPALDHTVYDGWQSIGERLISRDGKWIIYTIDVQQGDNQLVIQSNDGVYKKNIARAYNATITPDSRFAIFKVRPLYQETREARIKKKNQEDFPKESFGVIELGRDSIWMTPKIKSYKTPLENSEWVAYQVDKPVPSRLRQTPGDPRKTADSLYKIIDSLQSYIKSMPTNRRNNNRDESFDAEDPITLPADAGSDLILRKLATGKEITLNSVLEYNFSKNGDKLLIEFARVSKDSMHSQSSVVLYDLKSMHADTLSRGGNEYKNFAITDDGSRVAYLAEREAKPKDLLKFYTILFYKTGMDSAQLLINRYSVGMKLGMTVHESGNLNFSKSGNRLFFSTAAIATPRDTTLIDIDLVKLDVWHYNDDYLQTAQLSRLPRDLQENFLAMYQFSDNTVRQLASKEIPMVLQTNEGDGDMFAGVSDFGKRIESQWTGSTKKDIYAIDVASNSKKLIRKDLEGNIVNTMQSPGGKYLLWFDENAGHYFAYDGETVKNITSKITTALWNEEYDNPSKPPAYGMMGWQEKDSLVYIYDRYDVWCVDPSGIKAPYIMLPYSGRKDQLTFRYQRTNPDERFISRASTLLFKVFDNKDKESTLWINNSYFTKAPTAYPVTKPTSFGNVQAAKTSSTFIFTKEDYQHSANLYVSGGLNKDVQLSDINTQQSKYNWGTAELIHYKALNGKMSDAIVYKPEDFNPSKKYPLLFYFYETLSNGLFDYLAPSPTPSRLNIPFFVSRGYIVCAPDIHYTTGHPAQNAYDYVVGAATALVKNKWIDSKNMGIQGQSWGGIQVAQLVTMTDMFKAAWAGAPVANMTSAYGGIRWEGGVNRQFQYEKTQSRIGATLWEKPELYIENSPLFHLPKVKTPLVIMSNDADGAVPWYQGIELFTALRRLNKKVWLLNYNGEAHNLVDRKNRKDIQIREQQYFDWLLKGARPPRWITEGVPAVKKGKDWGLDIVE